MHADGSNGAQWTLAGVKSISDFVEKLVSQCCCWFLLFSSNLNVPLVYQYKKFAKACHFYFFILFFLLELKHVPLLVVHGPSVASCYALLCYKSWQLYLYSKEIREVKENVQMYFLITFLTLVSLKWFAAMLHFWLQSLAPRNAYICQVSRSKVFFTLQLCVMCTNGTDN